MLVNNSAYLLPIYPENSRARAYGILAGCVFLGQFLNLIITQSIVRKIGFIDIFSVWYIIVYMVIVPFFIKIKQKVLT